MSSKHTIDCNCSDCLDGVPWIDELKEENRRLALNLKQAEANLESVREERDRARRLYGEAIGNWGREADRYDALRKEKNELEVQLIAVKAELEAWKGAAKAAEKFRADVAKGTAVLCGESSDSARGVRDGVECILENGHEGFHQGKRGEMWS